MTATMIPPTPTPKPSPGGTGLRFVPIRADLLPNEVISARQTVVVRKQVLLGLLVVVGLLIAWYGLSWWQTSSAKGDLDSARQHGIALQNQQAQYAPLVHAQTQTQTIDSQLQKLMVGDLSWHTMLGTLRDTAPAGVALTGVTGTVTAGAANTGQTATPSSTAVGQPAAQAIGTVTIVGTAPNKNAVAAYSDKLAKVKGLNGPLITNVAVADKAVTFSLSVTITSDALGGRFTAPTTKTGGN